MPKFIPFGPVDGFYHVAYKVPGTNVFSSICMCSTEADAIDESDWLNSHDASFEADEVITITRE